MEDDKYLPEGYRWVTTHESFRYAVHGDSYPIVDVVNPDTGMWIGWAVPK